jgi:hypothetical protein
LPILLRHDVCPKSCLEWIERATFQAGRTTSIRLSNQFTPISGHCFAHCGILWRSTYRERLCESRLDRLCSAVVGYGQ